MFCCQLYVDVYFIGARVYICGKDKEEGESCIEEMRKTTKNEKIFFIQCDLRSFQSVRDFVDAFKKSEW